MVERKFYEIVVQFVSDRLSSRHFEEVREGNIFLTHEYVSDEAALKACVEHGKKILSGEIDYAAKHQWCKFVTGATVMMMTYGSDNFTNTREDVINYLRELFPGDTLVGIEMRPGEAIVNLEGRKPIIVTRNHMASGSLTHAYLKD